MGSVRQCGVNGAKSKRLRKMQYTRTLSNAYRTLTMIKFKEKQVPNEK